MSDEILIRLPGDAAIDFDAARDQFALVFAGEDTVVLRRQARDPGSSGQTWLRMFVGGHAVWAGDLLHALNLNHATGLLVCMEGSVRKEIFLRGGEIIFAQSNLADDRLGESLVRAGRITQDQLDEAAREISADRKLGRVLVDREWITAKELFVGVRRQVEEIVWSILDWPSRMLFYEGFADPESVIALNLETHRLLIEGIRRSSAWSAVPVAAPERAIVLQLAANPKNSGLNQEERRIAALAAKGITLRELIDQVGMGVLETYKVVHHLLDRAVLQVGIPVERSAAVVEGGIRSELEATIHNFSAIFADIVGLLRQRVPEIDPVARLNSFFEALPEDLAAVFGGVRFPPDGKLDTAAIAARAAGLRGARTAVLRAFNELLYFTMFEMKNHLSDEDTDRIMDIVEHMEIF